MNCLCYHRLIRLLYFIILQMRLFTYKTDEWYNSILIKKNNLDDAYYEFITNVTDSCYIVSVISWYID